jgi:hypothetical protein
MKTTRIKNLILLILGLAQHGYTQSFINLNFESATLIPSGGAVQFAQAFPGWIGTVGGVQQTIALSNNVYLDTSGISIITQGWINHFGNGGLIQGNYTAILQAGYGPGLVPADTSLSQTGLVPTNAQSLQFKAYQETDGSTTPIPFSVMLGGQALSLFSLFNGANYTLYGADISSFAGLTVPLAFTVFAENPHVDDQYLYLDSIQFSTQSVPEPSSLALGALGALLFGFRRWNNSLR